MTPRPLCQIELRPRDHRSALWWMGALFRWPGRFHASISESSSLRKITTACLLWLHCLPHLVLLCALGHILVHGFLDHNVVNDFFKLPRDTFLAEPSRLIVHCDILAFGSAAGVAGGSVFGLTVGLASWVAFGLSRGIAFGLSGGIGIGMVFGIAGGVLGVLVANPAASWTADWLGSIGLAVGLGVGVAIALTIGNAARLAFGPVVGKNSGLAAGLAVGLVYGLVPTIVYGLVPTIAPGGPTADIPAGGILRGISSGSAAAIAGGIAFGLAVGITLGSAGGRTFGIIVGLAGGLVSGLAGCKIGLTATDLPRSIAAGHPASVPDSSVTQLTVLGTDLATASVTGLVLGTALGLIGGIAFGIVLLFGYYSTLKTWTILLARQAGQVGDLMELSDLLAELPEGTGGFLGETRQLRDLVERITHTQASLNAVDRPIFREPRAQLLCSEIEKFRYRVGELHDPLKTEFRAAADRWLELARRQLDDVKVVVKREARPQVFRAGEPVDRESEAFVPRDQVTGHLERQVSLSAGCPGIVLYGRRRMGKTTVLRNLAGFLPPAVRPLTLSMQSAEAFASLESLVDLLVRSLLAAWPDGGPPEGTPRDLRGLSRLLSACDAALGQEGRRIILALDEYENIDRKIGDGTFSVDVLASVRDSIEAHRNLTWVFTGSHEITELDHAPWTSYLVSASTIDVPPFTEAETHLLLTEPLKQSTLWPIERPRPSFPAEFWGEGGIERIHVEAGGWPHLVQLIAVIVVESVNEARSQQVTPKLLERALDEAIRRGQNVLYELMHRESRLPGEWEYLSAFRRREDQPPPESDDIARSLRRRLLVVESGDRWRMRVPLMRRWLIQRG
jgi:hypothetical protein